MQYAFCKYCAHYVQHYYFSGHGFLKTECGHCKHPHIKPRKPNTPACVHYLRKFPDQ